MATIEPRSGNGGDEELRTVGVGASVCHGKEARAGVLELEVLVSELRAVDGLTTNTGAVSEVTTLDHELRNNTVESGTLVVERLARGATALFAGAECAEVLSGLGNVFAIQAKDDTAGGTVINCDVKENLVGNLLCRSKREHDRKCEREESGAGLHVGSVGCSRERSHGRVRASGPNRVGRPLRTRQIKRNAACRERDLQEEG